MTKTLGGVQFIRNGIQFDYCFEESIKCLLEFCDKVSVVDVGSDDGTKDVLNSLENSNKKLDVLYLTKEDWDNQQGKEKLAYFQNIATGWLDTDYQFLCQSDEIVHEKSYPFIRKAIETGKEAFMCKRINLWKSPYYYLNVPHERKPCSTEVIRLAKTKYQSIGDGESLDAQCVMDYVNDIDIWHYGFVRKREVMKSKVINMQRDVFGMEYDKKLDQEELFNPDLWFEPKTDLSIIDYPHPKIMLDWIKNRP